MKTGSFENEKEVVARAIENLYERSQFKISDTDLRTEIESLSAEEENLENRVLAKDTFSMIDEEGLGTLPISSGSDGKNWFPVKIQTPLQSYGDDYDGLLWSFYNRIFPIKFILYVLADELLTADDPKDRISFDVLKEAVKVMASQFGQFARSNKDIEEGGVDIGFPKSHSDFLKTPKLVRMRRRSKKLANDKSLELANTSRDRFSSQFLGRELQKSETNRRVLGACFEMGLIDATFRTNDKNFYAGLTQLGKEFLVLKNPTIEYFKSVLDDQHQAYPDSIFSDAEVTFIMKRIIPKFEYEKMIIDNILRLEGMNFVTVLTREFLKIRYEKSSQEIEQMEYDVKYPGKKGKISDGRTKFLSAKKRVTGIMKRLEEFDLVVRHKDGMHVAYEVKAHRVKDLNLLN